MRLQLSMMVFCALALLAIGCGESAESTTSTAAEPTATAPPAPRGPHPAVTDDIDAKPVITVPEQPTRRLFATDVVEGKGPEAKAGDIVTVDYIGVSQSTGGEFDGSWATGREPITFQLGTGTVIPGWDQGIAGMKVGSRRLLTIPPELAYGSAGSSGIPPNDTLVFAIDMRDIQQP